jgi:hypothetical protein
MDWEDLSPAEQLRIREGSLQLARLAWQYATPLIVASEGDADQEVNTASGFVLEVSGRAYLGTAAHVIESYKRRLAKTRYTYLQAGALGIDAVDRAVHYDLNTDLAFVDLTALDIERTNSLIYRPLGPWPPARPTPGDGIQFCGFPKAYRAFANVGEVDFGSLPGFGTVTTAGENYCTCQIARDNITAFGAPSELPPASAFGGLSGGPVLQFGNLAYPIIGLISEVSESFDIIRIATLENLRTFGS